MALKITLQKGMTLLELLVAMTLMVIISAIAYASLNGLIDAKIHTDEVANKLRQELLTSQQLTKDFNAMIKRKTKDAFGETKASIIGNYSSIEFTRNGHGNPLNQMYSDLQRVQWFIQDKQLIRGSQNFIDEGSFSDWQYRSYLDDIDELNISYINRLGVESRRWPVENANSPLKLLQFTIAYLDGVTLKYEMRPLLL
jgi:general secretion pathway protein J